MEALNGRNSSILVLLISVLSTNFGTVIDSVMEFVFQSLDLPYGSKNNFSFSKCT